MSTNPICAIVGVGPGNGAAFSHKFADQGYRVALLARNREYLRELETAIPGAKAYPYDATDEESASNVFAKIRSELGPVDVLIYNAASRAFANIDDTTPELFEQAWKVTTLGCLIAVKQVIPDMRKAGSGQIVITGATASLRGTPGFVAFGSAKAAQRSLAQSLARGLGPEGVHVAHVIIDGVIDMPASRRFMGDRPEEFFLRPDDIAESVFFLTQQPRSAWTFELDLRPYSEKW